MEEKGTRTDELKKLENTEGGGRWERELAQEKKRKLKGGRESRETRDRVQKK